jgi:AraC family ethanolamine operon transcriptional activator
MLIMKPPASIRALNKSSNCPRHEVMPHGRIQLEATDADQHAHNLTNWQQQYDQVSAGNFYGQLVEIQFEGLQLFQEHTSQALRQTCNIWDHSLWLGIPVNDNRSSKINGLSIEQNQVMCSPGNHPFELITPNEFDIYGLVVEQEKIQVMADNQGISINWSHLYQQGRLTLPDKTINALRFVLNNLLTDNRSQPRPAKLQHDVIMMALLESLENSQPVKSKPVSFFRRQQIVKQAKDYLYLHQDSAVTINDLCTLCHVSRRTLQYSFETILCMSPLRYLRLSRLNGARRELALSQNETIADIATKWGFWHLSQFTQDYKQLFNELPSVTLGKCAHERGLISRQKAAQPVSV